MSTDADILIIGGGPAGSACAIAAKRAGVERVELIDAGSPKLCGGLLNDEAQLALAELMRFDREDAARESLHVLSQAGVTRDPHWPDLLVEDWDNRSAFRTQPRYLNIDRDAFDAWLMDHAERFGAVIARNTRATSIERDDGAWRITLSAKSQQEGDASKREISAKILVIATGFHGLARLVPGYQPASVESYLALQRCVIVDSKRELPMLAAFSNKHCDYFGWIIPKQMRGESSIEAHVGCAVPPFARADGEAFIDEMCKRFGIASAAANCQMRGCPIAVPGSVQSTRIDALPGAFAIGEAAGLVSPASGDGISFALASGRIAGEVLARRVLAGKAHASLASYQSMLREMERAFRPLRKRVAKQIFKANVMASPRLRKLGTLAISNKLGRIVAAKLGVSGMK